MSQNLENFVKFQNFQLDNLVDFEKCCNARIYLQRSVPIQPNTSELVSHLLVITRQNCKAGGLDFLLALLHALLVAQSSVNAGWLELFVVPKQLSWRNRSSSPILRISGEEILKN